MTHAQALRCHGQRWLKIIWKMRQTDTAYDASLHILHMKRRAAKSEARRHKAKFERSKAKNKT